MKNILDTYIQIKQTCPICKGTGYLTHPEWQEYYKADAEYHKKHGKYMSYDQMLEYWKNKGYFFEEDIPAEEIQCDECEGKGYVFKWVEINELFNKISMGERLIEKLNKTKQQ